MLLQNDLYIHSKVSTGKFLCESRFVPFLSYSYKLQKLENTAYSEYAKALRDSGETGVTRETGLESPAVYKT